MRLLVYCPVPPQDLQTALGLPEYSYVFVAERFRPVLDQMGEVVEITEPAAQADALFRESADRGEGCVLICFSPPNRAPSGLSCPTICVFAWEFETIPTEDWAGQEHDWRRVLADHGAAICLSRHTQDAVRAAMGPDFPIFAIPAPIHDRFTDAAAIGAGPDLGPRSLTFDGIAIDSHQFATERTTLVPGTRLGNHHEREWNGAPLRITFTDTSPDRGSLVGFYRPEPWGVWSRTESPWLLLPVALSGRIRLRLNAVGYGPNADRRVTATIGGVSREFTLTAAARTHRLDFDLPHGTTANTVEFSGLTVSHLPDALDVRSMALGLCWAEIEQLSGGIRDRLPRSLRRALPRVPVSGPTRAPDRETVTVSGVVYTSVLNPADGRKNWEDMVTAFCWAFRNDPDATLLLKMTHHSLTSYFARLHFVLHRIGAMKCRVAALHGYLDDAELAELMRLTTFYVNSSEAEGLCMPLMEFMSAGVPAVSPDHTAMHDYVGPDVAFVVESSPFPTIWSHDPRQLWKAHKHRVHWDSLVQAYRDSAAVARGDSDRYRQMSRAAGGRMRDFSSDPVVRQALVTALDLVTAPDEVAR